MIKRIIRRMAEFRLMHRFVSHVDKHNTSGAEDESPLANVGRNINENLELIGKEEALKEFMGLASVSKPKATRIFKSAKHRHFINDGHNLPAGNDRTRLSVTHPEGEDFIQMWGRFPIGMWIAIAKHYSVVLSIIAIIISLIALLK